METLATQLEAQLDYEVRPLTHQDEDQIYALQKQHQAYFDLFLDHRLTKQEAIRDLDEVASDATLAQKNYLGLFEQNQLIATLDLTIDYPLPQLVWLGQFFVDAKHLSEADQEAIMATVLTTLKALTAVQVQLLVLKADQPGRHFYEAVGFQPVSETRTRINGQFVDAIVYQKAL